MLFVAGLATAAVAFIGLVFGANALLSPRNPTREKLEPYECGMEPQGDPWIPFNSRFAVIALLFVLFDAEGVLLFAVATKLRGSLSGLVEVGIFVGMLALGLVYAWRKGALAWRS